MAITGKIQDAAAAALSAIEEALDLNEPETAAGKDGPKSDKPSIAAAMSAAHPRALPVRRRRRASRSRRPTKTSTPIRRSICNCRGPPSPPTRAPPDPPTSRPTNSRPSRRTSRRTSPPTSPRPRSLRARRGRPSPRRPRQSPRPVSRRPRSPRPACSRPRQSRRRARPRQSRRPALRARAKTRRVARAKTGEARADDAARQRRPPQHRRVARRAELPPERNDHRHDGAVDHRLDGAVDALCLFPSREHFGRGRQFSGADADTDAAGAVRADRVPVRHGRSWPAAFMRCASSPRR